MSIEPFRPEDVNGVVLVLAASMTRDPVPVGRFVRQVLLDPNFRPEGALVARRQGRIVGFCLAIARQVPLENAAADADRGYITLMGVLPEYQRQGIGSRLLEEAEVYLRRQERRVIMISSYAPGYFIPGVDVEAYASGLHFFLKHGFAEVVRPISMQTSLWDLDVPEWIVQKRAALAQEGVTVEAYRPELTLPLLDFAKAEFAGDWVRVVRETAGRIMQGEPADRLIAAHESGRVLGYSHYDNERFGPIGVAASQRGRGLGQVLMFATLRAMRERGFRAAWFLWSDDKTARRLYDSAGFKEVRRFALLTKELS